MKETGYILAAESYLLRKGLAGILSRIPGTRMVREFESLSGLSELMRKDSGACLIISDSFYAAFLQTDAFTDEILERSILLCTQAEECPEPAKGTFPLPKTVIHWQDGKEKILDVLQKIRNEHQKTNDADPGLTPREKTIVRLVSMGMTNKQIADELFLSTHTVITHRKNISSKLGIKSVSGLTIYAIVNNIITIGELSNKA